MPTGQKESLTYCHPVSHQPLTHGPDGHLYDAEGNLAFRGVHGTWDFSIAAEGERGFHENLYSTGGWWADDTPLDAIDLERLWDQEPGCVEYLNSLGDVSGKTILLLGNGTSVKEFVLVRRGAHVVFTDLSLQGVLYAKNRYLASRIAAEHPDACEFHAVNACHLPFASESFDIIYADAVVHHFEDLSAPFAEIRRCLRPGGICRFLDTGYSSTWQTAKKGILRSLQKYTHRKHGISPEDQKATDRGGYTREELETLRDQVGFRTLLYKRVALIDYLLWRARCKLQIPGLLAVRPAVRGLDRWLARTPIMESQGIALIFGFEK